MQGPVYLRLSRLATPKIYTEDQEFEIGKAIQIGEGTDGTVIATGVTVIEALKAQEELKKQDIDIRVIDMHTIKPIDKDIIIKSAKETDKIIFSMRDNALYADFSQIPEPSQIAALLGFVALTFAAYRKRAKRN